MTENVENLILERLRRIDERLMNIENDVSELKTRAAAQDEHMSGVLIAMSGNNTRLDRLDERLRRIERRLDLTDAQ
jgi:uncharacterized coiled-coil protein SlyX